ncbi:MAG: hypothetical protein ABIK83_04290 [Candidatus Zixiibacteriota bacterium]
MNHQNPKKAKSDRVSWKGTLISVQPRIRLMRSFDERSHTYLGYRLRAQGMIGDEEREFSIGIGKAAQAKHQFRFGDVVSGRSLPVEDMQKEPVEFYKTSKLEVVECSVAIRSDQPPWHGVPPDLETYRERGHRRLDSHTCSSKCQSCIWGCRMPVEMIIDQWKPDDKRYRFETFCYGPKSCSLYEAGPTRKVPGRKSMTWEEPDWVDEEAVAHRGMDE